MSEKEYKEKCQALFLKNTILINENESLLVDNINLNRRISEMNEEFLSDCGGKCFAYQDLEAAYQMKVDEIEQLKKRIKNLVNAFNNYECAGPEQEQENTWETLRDLMHEELLKIENGEIAE